MKTDKETTPDPDFFFPFYHHTMNIFSFFIASFSAANIHVFRVKHRFRLQ